jgi:aminopeptidase N
MIVYQVELNDAPIQPGYADNNSMMILNLDRPLKPGEAAEMTIQYSVTAERGMNASYGQFGFQKNVFSGPEWYPMLSVYDEGAGWWMERPTTLGDAVYSESGLYETLLTVPQDFSVAMSGSQIDTADNGDGTKTLHYVSGPMRDSLLVAGPEFGRLTDHVDDIAVNIYYWPGGENVAEKVLKMSTDSIRIYNESFGPYPYAEFDLAETFNFTGIEYPGIVVIADRNWMLGNDFLEVTVAHEIAHQWWYSLVGNNQVDQPWLDESLTSYTEYLYTRTVHGPKKEKEARDQDRDYYNYYRGTGAPDLGLNLPVSAYNDNNYGVLIYVKGPLFFAELEQTLGTEKFLKALQLYFARYRYEVARPADVLNTFEEATGEQLDALFYQWVGEFPGLDPAVVREMKARQQEANSQ